jgi:hypothetical protein
VLGKVQVSNNIVIRMEPGADHKAEMQALFGDHAVWPRPQTAIYEEQRRLSIGNSVVYEPSDLHS